MTVQTVARCCTSHSTRRCSVRPYLSQRQHGDSSSPPLPHATPLPHSHTGAMENSDPLSEQGSARVRNLKAEIQTGAAFLPGLCDFHRRLLSGRVGSIAIFVAEEKRLKLRGGWTEVHREQSRRNSAAVEWSVGRRFRSDERLWEWLLRKTGRTAERPTLGRQAGRQGELGAAFCARDRMILSSHPLRCRTGSGIVVFTTECHANSPSATQTQWYPSTPKHMREGGVVNKRPKDAL